VRSLDTKFGLDEQAIKATKQWTFKPATKDGKPVPCPVAIEQSFFLNSTK
jgi:Gram-negative bacterial TonB protein C-terminal